MKWIVNILDEHRESGAWIVGPFETRKGAVLWAENHAPEGMWVVDELIRPDIYRECNPRV
jgi:hypothetical protein